MRSPFTLHRTRPSTTIRSIRLRTSRRPLPLHLWKRKGGWRLAQSRACLISAYPFFAFQSSPFSTAAYGVNKRTSADKGPAKISPRGPFRGNQREFADSFFSAVGLAGLKESRLTPTLLFISSFIRMRRNCRPRIVGMSIISTMYRFNYYAVYAEQCWYALKIFIKTHREMMGKLQLDLRS